MDEQEYRDEGLCKKCHTRRIDRTENKNSILCTECREQQIRYPFPKKMIPVGLAVFAMIVIAMARTPKVLEYYKMYSQSEEQAATGDIYPALLALQTVLDEYPDSVPVATRMTQLAMEHGYYDAAAYVLTDYLEGKSVNDATYAKLTAYSRKLNCYYNTYERVSELAAELGTGADGNLVESEALMSQMRQEMLAMTGDTEYDRALLYYYLALFTEDQDEALEYLKQSVGIDSKFSASSVAMGTNLRRRGDLRGARERYEAVLLNDRNDAGALRGLGILDLLEGEREQGLQEIRQAFETNPEEAYVRETLIIALKECEKTEEANSRMAEFEAEGVEFDEDFLKFMEGGVSLYDYYVGQ